MATPTTQPVAHHVDLSEAESLDVLGPTVTFLAAPEDGAPCVMRGSIPPGGYVPLHSHADPETFVALTDGMEGLVATGDDVTWVPVAAGEVFHVPGGARHAWHNRSTQPAVSLLISTARMGRFFREIGVPSTSRAAAVPEPDVLERFRAVSERYGYWNATPEENARVGIPTP
jgi:quercetin dioxygenase-like cupin family protein